MSKQTSVVVVVIAVFSLPLLWSLMLLIYLLTLTVYFLRRPFQIIGISEAVLVAVSIEMHESLDGSLLQLLFLLVVLVDGRGVWFALIFGLQPSAVKVR